MGRELGVSYDHGLVEFAELARAFHEHGSESSGMFHTQVISMDDSRSSGSHWFSVGVIVSNLKPSFFWLCCLCLIIS